MSPPCATPRLRSVVVGLLLASWLLAAAPALAEPTRWEYKVLTYNRVALIGNSEEELKLLGLQGWELVSTVWDPNARTIVCFLKRPLP